MTNYRRAIINGGTYFFTVNPLKHGYVKAVIDWPFSIFHRYVDQKIYGHNWEYGLNIDDLNFGE